MAIRLKKKLYLKSNDYIKKKIIIHLKNKFIIHSLIFFLKILKNLLWTIHKWKNTKGNFQ